MARPGISIFNLFQKYPLAISNIQPGLGIPLLLFIYSSGSQTGAVFGSGGTFRTLTWVTLFLIGETINCHKWDLLLLYIHWRPEELLNVHST